METYDYIQFCLIVAALFLIFAAVFLDRRADRAPADSPEGHATHIFATKLAFAAFGLMIVSLLLVAMFG